MLHPSISFKDTDSECKQQYHMTLLKGTWANDHGFGCLNAGSVLPLCNLISLWILRYYKLPPNIKFPGGVPVSFVRPNHLYLSTRLILHKSFILRELAEDLIFGLHKLNIGIS